MKTLLIGTVLAASAVTGAANLPILGPERTAFVQPAVSELAVLRALPSGKLSSMRAGAMDEQASLGAAERARIRQAQAGSPELAMLRAGEVDSTLLTILVVVAIIALVVVII